MSAGPTNTKQKSAKATSANQHHATTRRTPANAAKTSHQTPAARNAANNASDDQGKQPLLEPQVRLQLWGLAIEILAVALFIAVVAPGNAVVTVALSTGIRRLFGLGALALPFVLAAWGASFFIHQPLKIRRARLGLGVLVILMAAITLIALNTADATLDPALIFDPEALVNHGGYLGGGLAWALLSLLGYAISMVLMIGAVIVGAVLVGFSLSALSGWLNRLFHRRSAGAEPAVSSGPYDLGEAYLQPSTTTNAALTSADGMLAPTTRLSPERGRATAGSWLDYADEAAALAVDEVDDSDETAVSTAVTQRLRERRNRAGGPAGEAALAATAAEKPGPEVQPLYSLPNPVLLKVSRNRGASRAAEAELRAVAAELQQTLQQFQVDAQVVGWTAGPTVTLYKLALGEGVRVARITSLADDIALALAASSVRVFSPIPGTSLVGVEVPNAERSLVLLGDVLPAAPSGILQLAIGKDVEGSSIVANLADMPHLLIGGTTGSGKSVALNAMIMSVLMRATPAEIRMILIDPKMVELTRYNDIPHLYVPVVTDAAKAAAALNWSVGEMERRLKIFMEAGVKNIAAYNEQIRQERQRLQREAERSAARSAASQPTAAAVPDAPATPEAESTAASMSAESIFVSRDTVLQSAREQDDQLAAWQEVQSGPASDHAADSASAGNRAADSSSAEARPGLADPAAVPVLDLPEEMPLIMIVIDELADLMIIAGKDVEASITRLSQLARAAGLHLIIATQRPSTNVITGVIKANIVNRIAFNVGSGIDSRVILDSTGAEALLGHGDLLFSRPEYGKPVRIQGCLVADSEIADVTAFWKRQGQPQYHEEILATAVNGLSSYPINGLYDNSASDDPLVWEAADIVVSTQMGSTSTLQRRLKVGYARAGRIMDNLEQKGIVGPANGSKPREVFVSDILELESIRALEAVD